MRIISGISNIHLDDPVMEVDCLPDLRAPASEVLKSCSVIEGMGDSLKVTSRTERTTYTVTQEHSTIVALQLQAAADESKATRKPLDLVLVIDRSWSMREDHKLDGVKQTVRFILSELAAWDRLALVYFDTNVKVEDFVQLDARGKDQIERSLAKVEPGCSTNLSGGLWEGLKHFEKLGASDHPTERVRSLLLLTDGLANVGVKETPKLVGLLQSRLVGLPSLIIHTFGYGKDHCPDMLSAIACAGGGMYYNVPNAADVSFSFADCLGGLLSVVAQNVVVTLHAAEGHAIEEVLDSKHPVAALPGGRGFEVRLADMLAEEARTLLLRVRLPALPPHMHMLQGLRSARAPCVTVGLAYMDIAGARSTECVGSVWASRTAAPFPEVGDRDLEVAAEKCRLQTAAALDAAKAAAGEGKLKQARAVLEAALAEVSAVAEEAQRAGDGQCVAYMAELERDLREGREAVADTAR